MSHRSKFPDMTRHDRMRVYLTFTATPLHRSILSKFDTAPAPSASTPTATAAVG